MVNNFNFLLEYKNTCEKSKSYWDNFFERYGKENRNDIGIPILKLDSASLEVFLEDGYNEENNVDTSYYNADKINVWRNNITDTTNYYYYETDINKQPISDDTSDSPIGKIKNRLKTTYTASYKKRNKLKFKYSKKGHCNNKRKIICKSYKEATFADVQFECDDILESHVFSNNPEMKQWNCTVSELENSFKFHSLQFHETPSRNTNSYRSNNSSTENDFIKKSNGLEVNVENSVKSKHVTPMHLRSKDCKRTDKNLERKKNIMEVIEKIHKLTQLYDLNNDKSEVSTLTEKSGVLDNSSGDKNTEKSIVQKNRTSRTKLEFSKMTKETNNWKNSSTEDSSDLKLLPDSSCKVSNLTIHEKINMKLPENHDFSTDSSEKSIENLMIKVRKDRIKKAYYSKLENQNWCKVSNLTNHEKINNKNSVDKNSMNKESHNSTNKSFEQPKCPVLNRRQSSTFQKHCEYEVVSISSNDEDSSMKNSVVNKNEISHNMNNTVSKVSEKQTKENCVEHSSKQNSRCFELTACSWDLSPDAKVISEILRSPFSPSKTSFIDNKQKNNFEQTPLSKNNNNVFISPTSSNENTHQNCFKSKTDIPMKNFKLYRTKNNSPASQIFSLKRNCSSDYSEESAGRVRKKKLKSKRC